jgi:predicted metal-dependent peptidase
MALDARSKLAAAIIRVVGVDPYNTDANKRGLAPYFGAILRGLVRREAPGLGTIGVSKVGVLYWDPAFVDKTTTEELSAGLIHEVMHVALKHCQRFEDMGVVAEATSDQGAKAFIANMAADLAINPDVEKMAALPKGGLFPKDFDLPDGLVMEEYYRLLLKQAEEQQQQDGGGGQGEEDGEGEDGEGQGQGNKQGKPAVGKGWCGSCAGHPLPQEPAAQGKKDEEGRSEADMERFRKQSAEAVREAAQKNRGFVPDSLKVWADQILSPPKIPWREKLARIVRGAVAYKSGAVDLTWKRPSRRQAGVGYGIGRPIVPAMHAPVPDVAVVVDTSGSMGDSDLAAAASELGGVLDAVGAKVTVVACDAEVHGLRECKTIHEAVELFVGGGGTSMEPAMQALLEKRPQPSVVIICTDGHIGDGYLKHEPPYKVIWCVVGAGGNTEPCPYGDVVVVDDSAVQS